MNKPTKRYNTRQATKSTKGSVDGDVFRDKNNENVSANVNKKARAPAKRLLSAGDEVPLNRRKRLNSKKQQQRTKSEGAKSDLYDSIYFDIVDAHKKQQTEQRKKKAEERKKNKIINERVKAVKNVMISTPTNNKRKDEKPIRQALCIDISPIKANESIGQLSIEVNQSSADSILLMRRRELQREAELKTPDLTWIREAKEYVAQMKEKKRMAQKKSIDWNSHSETSLQTSNIPSIIVTPLPPDESLSKIDISISQQQEDKVQQTTSLDKSISMMETSQEQDEENEVSHATLLDQSTSKMEMTSSQLSQNKVEMDVEAYDEVFVQSNNSDQSEIIESIDETPGENGVSSLQASISAADSNSMSIPELDLSEKLDETLTNESIDNNLKNTRQKIVKFLTPEPTKSSAAVQGDVSKVKLKPGKWQKSLIAWRKSHNLQRPGKDRSRKFSALFPIKTDPATIKRFTQNLQQSLEKSALLEQSDEGSLHELSLLDSSIECTSFHETFIPKWKTSKRETSVFNRSSIFYGLASQLINVDVLPSLSARQIALRRCGQQEPLPFDDIYSESQLPNCKKIGEGVYGEVFMYKPPNECPIVLKIIPIEGELLVNGEQQKSFDEILSEIVISMELSALRNDKENSTDGFVNVKRVTCVKGVYPQHLIDEWEKFSDGTLKGSENDHPEIFDEDQLYVVFELCNAGVDLEAYQFKNAEESYSIFLQIALTLAVAESKFEFEHRDLHWGNVLISRTAEKFTEYRIDGKVIKIQTYGVKATIIDYTLSRMIYDGAVLYDDLAKDEVLFEQDGEGEYQFEIYRLMRDRLENDFRRFDPYTNLLWLHYLVDKLIDGARYRFTKSDKHKGALNKMMHLRDELLDDYLSASEFVKSFTI